MKCFLVFIYSLFFLKFINCNICENQFDSIFCGSKNDLYLTYSNLLFTANFNDHPPFEIKFLRKIKTHGRFKIKTSIVDHENHFYHFQDGRVFLETSTQTFNLNIDKIFNGFKGKLKYAILIPNFFHFNGHQLFKNIIQLYTDLEIFTYFKRPKTDFYPVWNLKQLNNTTSHLSQSNLIQNSSYQIKHLIGIQNDQLIALVKDQQSNLFVHKIDIHVCSSILFGHNLVNCVKTYSKIESTLSKEPIVSCFLGLHLKYISILTYGSKMIFFIIILSLTCILIYFIKSICFFNRLLKISEKSKEESSETQLENYFKPSENSVNESLQDFQISYEMID